MGWDTSLEPWEAEIAIAEESSNLILSPLTWPQRKPAAGCVGVSKNESLHTLSYNQDTLLLSLHDVHVSSWCISLRSFTPTQLRVQDISVSSLGTWRPLFLEVIRDEESNVYQVMRNPSTGAYNFALTRLTKRLLEVQAWVAERLEDRAINACPLHRL